MKNTTPPRDYAARVRRQFEIRVGADALLTMQAIDTVDLDDVRRIAIEPLASARAALWGQR